MSEQMRNTDNTNPPRTNIILGVVIVVVVVFIAVFLFAMTIHATDGYSTDIHVQSAPEYANVIDVNMSEE